MLSQTVCIVGNNREDSHVLRKALSFQCLDTWRAEYALTTTTYCDVEFAVHQPVFCVRLGWVIQIWVTIDHSQDQTASELHHSPVTSAQHTAFGAKSNEANKTAPRPTDFYLSASSAHFPAPPNKPLAQHLHAPSRIAVNPTHRHSQQTENTLMNSAL